jgi:hypothetical protein
LHHAIDDAFHVADAFERFADGVAGQGVAHKPGHGVVAFRLMASMSRSGWAIQRRTAHHSHAGLVKHCHQRTFATTDSFEDLEVTAGLRVKEHHAARGVGV